jgi:hypothetical protein
MQGSYISSDCYFFKAIYVIVNICTGNVHHKKAILMSNSIIDRIFQLLSHNNSHIRVAVVWCIINLTWPDELGKSSLYYWRSSIYDIHLLITLSHLNLSCRRGSSSSYFTKKRI